MAKFIFRGQARKKKAKFELFGLQEANLATLADDTMLLEVVDNSISSAEVLNHDLNKISEWADKWLVTMNPSITRSMTFSITKYKLNHPIISMVVCGCPIEEVVTQPHLGLKVSKISYWGHCRN
jgi:hypothetical protein